jgi:cellulose biosynthesis protein BcsQ
MGKTIFVGARKGGVGKTMTAASLGFGLARAGKRVLCVDADSQHSLTVSLGERKPDGLTLTTVMTDIINEREIDLQAGVLHHDEGVDFLPVNSSLTGIELALAPLIGRGDGHSAVCRKGEAAKLENKIDILASKYGEDLQAVSVPMTEAALKKLVGGKFETETLYYPNQTNQIKLKRRTSTWD